MTTYSEQLPVPENIEAIAVCKRILNFGIVYVPTNSPDSYHNSVIKFIHSLPLTNNTIIIVGWETLTTQILTGPPSQVLIQIHPCSVIFIFDTNFIQLIETPTHVAGHVIDLVLTNHNHSIQNLTLDSKLPSQLSSDTLLQNLLVNPSKVYNYISFINSENQIPLSVYLGSTNSHLDEDKVKLFNQYISFPSSRTPRINFH